jgi:hypothetical protein
MHFKLLVENSSTHEKKLTSFGKDKERGTTHMDIYISAVQSTLSQVNPPSIAIYYHVTDITKILSIYLN